LLRSQLTVYLKGIAYQGICSDLSRVSQLVECAGIEPATRLNF